MKVTVICVGKIKENYFLSAIKEYSKRLSRFCTFEIIEVADEKCPEKLSPKEKDLVIKKEGDRIISHLDSRSYVINLCISGKTLSSEGLARKIKDLAIYGKSHITFIIGGSLGLSCDVIGIGNLSLSFSAFTFPHQLMRVFVVEQIYRCFMINTGSTYHK